ncbi:MAG: peptidyl-prolyl cis-trans isomerase, partial [Gammaproteobacteria bacterium]
GYRIGDQAVAEHIRAIPQFQVGGEFSELGYKSLLDSQGISALLFESEQRDALAARQFQEGIVNSSFFTPTDFRRFMVLEGEQRQVSYVVFEPQSFADTIALSDEDIEAYYQANLPEFEREESVNLEYLEIDLASIREAIVPDEAALRAFYDESLDTYKRAEQRESSHILIAVDADTDAAAADELAAALKQRLSDGEDFAALATEYSDDPGSAAEGGSLGWNSSGVFVEPFEDALYALQMGEVSEPVTTEFGVHLIRLDGLRAGEQKPFAEVREELAAELSEREAEDIYFARIEELDDLALQSLEGLAPVAEDMGLDIQRAENFTRNGGLPLGFDPALVDAAFSLEVLEDGENSPVVQLSDGRAIVMRLVEHRFPETRPFDEVREQVLAMLMVERSGELAQEAGQTIVEAVSAGTSFAAAAASQGAEIVQSGLLNRGSQDVPPDLLPAIFSAPIDGASSGPEGLVLSTGGYAVFQVNALNPGRPETVPREQRDQRKRQLAQQSGQVQAAAVTSALRQQASVSLAADLFSEPDAF